MEPYIAPDNAPLENLSFWESLDCLYETVEEGSE